MGTLTADMPRLPHYCPHKLPTSCRLTSLPNCCACADERPHAASYSTYIDGVGFVQRGKRWQRYCWFCKEFWENRVEASGLRFGQTKVPEVPDQSGFLERWYEFHAGWRIERGEDGEERRVKIEGEELKEVAPGVLPRTVEEMREGRERSEVEASARAELQLAVAEETPSGPNLEETLDQLFESAEAETEAEQLASAATLRRANVHAQAMVATGSRNSNYQSRRIAALRRELHRMRNGIERVISGLRDLGETVPDATDATSRLTSLGETLDDIAGVPSGDRAELAIRSVNDLTNGVAATQADRAAATVQARVDEARDHMNEARRMRDQVAAELDVAEQEFRTSQQRLQQLQRDQRTQENYTRIFGTREEMLAQGDEWESPIGGMFNRAMERFQAAETVRRDQRTLRQVLADEQQTGGEDGLFSSSVYESPEGTDVWSVPLPPRLVQNGTSNTTHLMGTARDEVFAGQDLTDMLHEIADPDEDDDAGQHSSLSSRFTTRENFPRSMLRHAPRRRRLGPQLDPNRVCAPFSSTSEDDRQDFVALLWGLHGPAQQIRQNLGLSLEVVEQAIYECGRVSEGPDWESRITFMLDGVRLENLLLLDDLVWTSMLPAKRLIRARNNDYRVVFSCDADTHYEEFDRGNIELMAEAFQMSANVRRASRLFAPEQLRMLYRLQRGEREASDREILGDMMRDRTALELATNVHREHYAGMTTAQIHHLDGLRGDHRQAAREGSFSREGLDGQRVASRGVALAAARAAVQAGLDRPRTLDEDAPALLDQSQAQHERRLARIELLSSTRARLPNDTRSDGTMSEPDDSEAEESDDGKGLDARDTGRPEPKTDEEMTVKLECRVCYSQVADVACLPCGHLTFCSWCSEQHSPVMNHDRTRPRRAASCPVCRKGIRQKVKIYRA
nr:hypothetical protein B0A51_09592 [Rachicladosporium sp. CCFEE 5018]